MVDKLESLEKNYKTLILMKNQVKIIIKYLIYDKTITDSSDSTSARLTFSSNNMSNSDIYWIYKGLQNILDVSGSC